MDLAHGLLLTRKMLYLVATIFTAAKIAALIWGGLAHMTVYPVFEEKFVGISLITCCKYNHNYIHIRSISKMYTSETMTLIWVMCIKILNLCLSHGCN